MSTATSARAITWQRRRAAARQLWREFTANRGGLVGLCLLGLVVALALLAPVITDESGLDVTQATGSPLRPPSGEFPLGTDVDGRSVLLLTLWGARVSLLVGFSATLLSVLIGTLVGIAAAHFGGWVANLLLRVTDFFLVLPSLILAIALSTVLPQGIPTIILAVGVTSWPTTARLVRAQTLTIESRPYIERARALGGGHLHIVGKHVLPAVLPLVLANTTLVVGSSIIAESTLSFLGLGDPSAVSWGSMLQRALQSGAVVAGAWWYLLPPGIAIVVVVLSFTLVGRALETVLNPRLKAGRA
ncbi:peptide/nickel transport system permease protein [Amycolatopsis arida]|uniref:Peptide/nickel transport system permease protein n=1 Tax=Amycolatopsis arida TaxID=587909 RepID=A0A1I5ZEE0_9PSEU|nr:ABC transporter permease [Amycolatopsis arida]TDX89580.1 peptide/nickel transport system permease protein [Amycolatopsis arida]SFQ54810.1 peptide/nickel transport system permease protein [Amycolatopsis arida]